MNFIKALVRGAFGILALVLLIHFVPGIGTLVFGFVLTLCVWPMALLSLLLMYRTSRIGKKIGLSGKLRAEFAFKRAFRDISTKAYDNLVYGDDSPLSDKEFNRLERHDRVTNAAQPATPKPTKATAQPAKKAAPQQARPATTSSTPKTTASTAAARTSTQPAASKGQGPFTVQITVKRPPQSKE